MRLRFQEPVEDWIKRVLGAMPVLWAPVTFEIALESRRIQLPHQDPADRFLAATAKVLDLILVTADKRLCELSEFRVLRN